MTLGLSQQEYKNSKLWFGTTITSANERSEFSNKTAQRISFKLIFILILVNANPSVMCVLKL